MRMGEKGGKKKTIKKNENVLKDKKTITLKLDNDIEIPAKNIYKKDSRVFKINDIDIDKKRVSDKKLYIKSMIHTSIMFFMKMAMNIFL